MSEGRDDQFSDEEDESGVKILSSVMLEHAGVVSLSGLDRVADGEWDRCILSDRGLP